MYLTFLNEVTKSDNILKSIEAIVIDSCIEVIIGLPDIRSKYPFDNCLISTNRARCKGSLSCDNCACLIAKGHDNTLCSLAGRPHTPKRRDTLGHRMFTEDERIKKNPSRTIMTSM